jgi:predicted transcriptional regulator
MDEQIVVELVTIKRLIIFALMRNGASQGEVAKALGIGQSQVSRMFAGTEKTKGKRVKG